MKKVFGLSVFGFILPLTSCFDVREFSSAPSIAFESLVFSRDMSNSIRPSDTLKLTFSFEDNEGDIGLDPDEVYNPYHSFDVIVDSEGVPVTLTSESVPPFYSFNLFTRGFVFFSETDDRPVQNCRDYQETTLEVNGQMIEDFYYVKRNPFSKNFYLNFYIRRKGKYELFSFFDTFFPNGCENFDARIRRDIINDGRSGFIIYDIYSRGIENVIQSDSFKVEFYIIDRALNISNTADSRAFTLKQITQ